MSGKLKLCIVTMFASLAASLACFATSMVYVCKENKVEDQMATAQTVEEVESLTEQKEKYESSKQSWTTSSLLFSASTMLWTGTSMVVSKEREY